MFKSLTAPVVAALAVFADGDFQSYRVYGSRPIRGNLARICYMLANRPGDPPIRPVNQDAEKRILARTQHILTSDKSLDAFPDFDSFDRADWYEWNNIYEYDRILLGEWENISLDDKKYMLSVISDIRIDEEVEDDDFLIGATIEPAGPNSVHMLLCEGVGEFAVQGWSSGQWVPEIDPDGDGDLEDTDFVKDKDDPSKLSQTDARGIWYLCPPYSEEDLSSMAGFGRALKFTFTLYDSKGVIKEGRTFTHIVYLN